MFVFNFAVFITLFLFFVYKTHKFKFLRSHFKFNLEEKNTFSEKLFADIRFLNCTSGSIMYTCFHNVKQGIYFKFRIIKYKQ